MRMPIVAGALFPTLVLGGCNLLDSSPPKEMLSHCLAWGSAQNPELLDNLSLGSWDEFMRARKAPLAWRSLESDEFEAKFKLTDPMNNESHMYQFHLVRASTPSRDVRALAEKGCDDKTLTVTRMYFDGERLGSYALGSFMSDLARNLMATAPLGQRQTAAAVPGRNVDLSLSDEATSSARVEKSQPAPGYMWEGNTRADGTYIVGAPSRPIDPTATESLTPNPVGGSSATSMFAPHTDAPAETSPNARATSKGATENDPQRNEQ